MPVTTSVWQKISSGSGDEGEPDAGPGAGPLLTGQDVARPISGEARIDGDFHVPFAVEVVVERVGRGEQIADGAPRQLLARLGEKVLVGHLQHYGVDNSQRAYRDQCRIEHVVVVVDLHAAAQPRAERSGIGDAPLVGLNPVLNTARSDQ